MARMKLKTVFRPLGHTRSLLDGAVTKSGFELDYVDVPVLVKGFRRMVRELEFDVCEMALTTYLCAKSFGKGFTALPIFPARGLHHRAILYNRQSDIRNPRDFEGRTVGVNRGYTVTTGVWARGILQDRYGVDLDQVSWLLSGDEHVEEYRAPSNVSSIEGGGKSLADRLGDGEIAGAIGIQTDHPDIEPLIGDADEVAFAALRDDGFYPINHTVVVKDELLETYPGLAAELFGAFAQAKKSYIDKLKSGTMDKPTEADALNQRIFAAIGDPLPYGIAPNRKMLDTLIEYAYHQHIIPERYDVESLFAKGTEALVG